MKILAIHNFHRTGSISGDDQVFKDETRLLEDHDNEVIRYSISNDEFDRAGKAGKVLMILGMLWSWKNYKAVQELIRTYHPDIVHIHTFFPILSPSILYAAKRKGVPVVATLHDTRFICPCSTSLRANKLCNECSDGDYYRMCKYRCFKGSRTQSFWVATVFKYHRVRRSFYDQIDKYICLNDEQIKLLTSTGFDKNKIVKKYNFVADQSSLNQNSTHQSNHYQSENIETKRTEAFLPNRYIVFYGRIGEEKGIRVLMKAWERINIPLVVMGGGPLEDDFKAWSDKHSAVTYLGYTGHEKCLEIVSDAEFVVFPSIWYEGCSMVEIESMSLGKGIIATNLGFSAETVIDGYNGYKFPLGDYETFITKVTELWNDPERCKIVGANAKTEYENKYQPEDNYKQLMAIYDGVLKNRH